MGLIQGIGFKRNPKLLTEIIGQVSASAEFLIDTVDVLMLELLYLGCVIQGLGNDLSGCAIAFELDQYQSPIPCKGEQIDNSGMACFDLLTD